MGTERNKVTVKIFLLFKSLNPSKNWLNNSKYILEILLGRNWEENSTKFNVIFGRKDEINNRVNINKNGIEKIKIRIKELIFVRFSKWSRMSEIGIKNDIVITRNTNAKASIILSTKMVLIPVVNLIDDFWDSK